MKLRFLGILLFTFSSTALATPMPCLSMANTSFTPKPWPTRTWPRLMDFREQRAQDAITGFRATGLLATGLNDGVLYPVDCGDDPGLFLLSPLVATFAGRAAPAVVLVAGMLVFGILGWFAVPLSLKARAIYLFVLALMLAKGDTYGLQGAFLLCAVLWMWKLRHQPAFFVLVGLAAGTVELFRRTTWIGVLVFAILCAPRRKLLYGAVVLVSALIPSLASRAYIAHRNQELAGRTPFYLTMGRPVLWHHIYIGQGFVGNSYVPLYDDGVGLRAVQEVKPDAVFMGPEYEAILRHKVILLALHRPDIIFINTFAKLGVICGFLLVFGNLGWRRMLRTPVNWAFAVTLLVVCVPMVLAAARPSYMMGPLAVMYAWWIAETAETDVLEISKLSQSVAVAH